MDTIQVLALGGNEVPWHRFEEKGPLLEAFLEADGIDVEATTARSVLVGRVSAYDVVVDYRTQNGSREAERDGLLDFVRSGGGYVPLHGASLVTDRAGQPFRDLVGGAFVRHPDNSDLTVEIVADHPVVAGVETFDVYDEPYELEHDDVTVLAETEHDSFGRMPVVWVHEYGEGRVAYCALGHFDDTFRNENFERIVSNAVRWTAEDR